MKKIIVNYIEDEEQAALGVDIGSLEMSIINLYQNEPYLLQLKDNMYGNLDIIVKVSFSDDIILVDNIPLQSLMDNLDGNTLNYDLRRVMAVWNLVGRMILDKAIIFTKDRVLKDNKHRQRVKQKWIQIHNKTYAKKDKLGQSYTKSESEWLVRTHVRHYKNGNKVVIAGYNKKFKEIM